MAATLKSDSSNRYLFIAIFCLLLQLPSPSPPHNSEMKRKHRKIIFGFRFPPLQWGVGERGKEIL